jgi:hypothetical protein
MSKRYASASENFSACSHRVTMGGKKKFTPEGSRPGGEPWWYPDFLPRLDSLRAPCRFASLLQQNTLTMRRIFVAKPQTRYPPALSRKQRAPWSSVNWMIGTY